MDNLKQTSHLRKLLIEPQYKWVRHLLLVSILAIIALNQSFMTLRAGIEVLGYRMFLQALFLFITYLIVCYFNLWVLLPRYLLKRRYGQYLLCLTAMVFGLVLIHTTEERAVLTHIGRLDEFYRFPRIFFTIFSSFALVLLCVSGGAMTVVLKRWLTDNQRVNQLEKLHVRSEVEQLKEQVSPNLLFNILNRMGVLAKVQPQRASDMLIRLSQLLRYQLYDCNRDKVLLSAEIKFLNNYLALEQMYAGSFDFSIRSDKECSHKLISPMLLISFVQYAVGGIQKQKEQGAIHIALEVMGENSVTFICRCEPEALFFDMDFSKTRKRLDFLYNNHYSLAVTGREVNLKLDI